MKKYLFILAIILSLFTQSIANGDKELSISEFTKKANNGDADAQYKLGDIYARADGVARDFKKAFYWYEKADKQGNADAQYSLGGMYYNGIGVEKDYEKAKYFFKKSYKKLSKQANNGDADAQIKLGTIYALAMEDYKKARYWFKKAADQGNADGQLAIGLSYFSENNYIKCYAWANVAATNGSNDAPPIRNICENELNPDDLIKAQLLSNKYYELYSK